MFGKGQGSVVGAQALNLQVLDSHFVRVMGRIYSAGVSLFVKVAQLYKLGVRVAQLEEA